jgi:hypothetical protein
VQVPRAIAVLIALMFASELANALRASMPFYSLPVEAQVSISAELARSLLGEIGEAHCIGRAEQVPTRHGGDVSVSGNTVAVGASGAQIGQIVGAGAVYVFVEPRTGGKHEADSKVDSLRRHLDSRTGGS